MGIVALNNYEVDAFEEPCIFGDLASMQPRALIRFMTQLKLICVGSNGHTHHDMLLKLDKRVKEQLERLRTRHERKEG